MALAWQGTQEVSMKTCPDPMIQQPTDAIMRMNSLAAYGWHLHLHDVPDLYLRPDNISVTSRWASWSRWSPRSATPTRRPRRHRIRNLPRTLTLLTSCYPVLRFSQPTDHPDPGGRDSCSRPAKAA